MISSKFPSFRGASDLVVFYDFFVIFRVFLDFQKLNEHHQVTSTPKTLRKLAWNHLTVFWLNFEKSRRFLFAWSKPQLCLSENYHPFLCGIGDDMVLEIVALLRLWFGALFGWYFSESDSHFFCRASILSPLSSAEKSTPVKIELGLNNFDQIFKKLNLTGIRTDSLAQMHAQSSNQDRKVPVSSSLYLIYTSSSIPDSSVAVYQRP